MDKKIIAGLAILSFLIIPGIANATFFDDGRWYMDSSWWVDYSDGDPPSGGTAEFVDTPTNDRLDWLTSGWTTGEDVFRAKASKWTFDLNDDFEFTIGFHYDHTGNYDTDEGGIEMGLYYFDDPSSSEPSHAFSIAADNWVSEWHGAGLENRNVGWWGVSTPTVHIDGWWPRYSNDGVLRISYNSSDDWLQIDALDDIGGGRLEQMGSTYYGDLRQSGLSQLGVYFAGWSEGAGLSSGDAYLQNFVVHKGTITPEPVSSILFLVGGASLAAVGYRRRKTARA